MLVLVMRLLSDPNYWDRKVRILILMLVTFASMC
jgi:hypothetical protein